MTENELEAIRKIMTAHHDKVMKLMEDCPHKVIYPSREAIVNERVAWCNEHIKGAWGEFNLGNDHIWCFQEIKDAVYFKTFWGTLTWEDLYERDKTNSFL